MNNFIQTDEEIIRLANNSDKDFQSGEIYYYNDLYSHASVFRKYSDYNSVGGIKAAIEHGFFIGDDYMPKDVQTDLSGIITFSKNRVNLLSTKTSRLVVSLGHPINYCDYFYKKDILDSIKSKLGKTLLYFPSHSTPYVKASYDFRIVEQHLLKFKERFNSIIVCLYWKDIQDGLFDQYRNKGFICCTAGYRSDPNFLARLKSFIYLADSTVSDNFGSHIGLCSIMNKPHVILNNIEISVSGYPGQSEESYLSSMAPLTASLEFSKKEILTSYNSEKLTINSDTDKIAKKYFGIDEPIESREHVRLLLEIFEDLYQLGKDFYEDYKNCYELLRIYKNSSNENKFKLLSWKLNEYEIYKNNRWKFNYMLEKEYSSDPREKEIEREIQNNYINPVFSNDNLDIFYVRKSILAYLDLHKKYFKGVLLDLGCGKMPYRKYILNNSSVSKYIGMDIENPNYQENEKPDLFWNGNEIPLSDNSIDTVLATELLEHLPEPEKILKEIYRILKPGGSLFFTVPFLWPLHDVPFDEYRYTPFSMERILKNAGFNEIKIEAMGGWNASLAQMIALWLKRSDASTKLKTELESPFIRIIQKLSESDTIPVKFEENTMPTGFSGIATKIEGAISIQDESRSAETCLAICSPFFGALSETFIKNHIERIKPGKTVVLTSNIVNKNWVNVPFIQVQYGMSFSKYDEENERKIVAFFNEHKVSHILVEYGCHGTEIVELNARKLKLPIFIHFFGFDASQMLQNTEMVSYYKWMYNNVNGIVTINNPMTTRLQKIFGNDKKLIKNSLGISIPITYKNNISDEICRFIFVGRFVEKKAPLHLIKAFLIAFQKYPKMTLDMIGNEGVENKNSELFIQTVDMVREFNLENIIRLHGARSHEYMFEQFEKSSVYVQHSITAPDGDAEGLPIAILEAASYGLPVISTFHEGIPEEVENNVSGFLVQENDIETMAEKMIELAKSIPLRKKMGEAGRKKMEEEFRLEYSIKNLQRIIFS